jgi:hypothetical protein
MRKLTLFGIVAVGLVAVLSTAPAHAQARCRSNTALCLGDKNTDVYVQGNLYINSPDGGSAISTPGTATNAGTLRVGTLDAGVANIQGNLTIAGKVPVLRADVLDAGQIFAQGFGPVTRLIPWTATIDFVTATTTCTESSAITVTGARTNDGCVIGPPTSGGSTNAAYTCYVSATDAVKARHCAAGTADDPASATFSGVVISTAQ